VQDSRDAGVDVPQPVDAQTESRQAQLNLGGIIALGVFGGFVFLAAIITTIVILIRRKETIEEPMFRTALGSEVDREVGGEVVVASQVNREKKHHRHHHHHHHHKHRHGEDRERSHRHHKY